MLIEQYLMEFVSSQNVSNNGNTSEILMRKINLVVRYAKQLFEEYFNVENFLDNSMNLVSLLCYDPDPLILISVYSGNYYRNTRISSSLIQPFSH